MKKCASCMKDVDDLCHQCPYCGGDTFIQSGSEADSSSLYESMEKQSEAAKLVDKSVILINAGKYNEAEKVLKEAIDINPYNATAHANMGGVFHRQRRLKEAVPWLEKAIELNPYIEGVPDALQEVRSQLERLEKRRKNKNLKPTKNNYKKKKGTRKKKEKISSWKFSAAVGVIGGVAAALIFIFCNYHIKPFSYLILLLTTIIAKGFSRKVFAGLLFIVTIFLVLLLFKQ